MKCKIILKDEVNCKLEGLELTTRRKCEKKLKFFLQHARHTPAYKLGRWDGCISFFTVGGNTFVNALPHIFDIIQNDGYEIEIDDRRAKWNIEFPMIAEDHFGDKSWPEGHPVAGTPVILRDYQVEIINKFLANPQSIQEIATGAGKTLMTASLSNLIEPYGRSIVIVPNKDLVTQTEEDYINLGLDVGVYFGDRKEYGKTHTICTWQSLNIIEKNYRDGKNEMSLDDFAEDVVCIMVDEVHQAKADVLKKLLTGSFRNVPIRWGLTGTVPKEDSDRLSLEVGLGEVVHQLAASDLQDQGVLSSCDITILQMQDDVAYDNYQSELTFLTTNNKRLDYLAKKIQEMSLTGNTLVLVDRIAAGQGLVERLGDDVVFVSGNMKSKDRKTEYDSINTGNNTITIATYGVAAVGINIPRIFNLVLVEPGKSFVRVIQSIGRGIRKAKDKDNVQIWDITSNAKFSKRHLTERKRYYKDANYPFKIEKVNYKND
jgi:superfamily II DNA or RNA helicase